MESIVYIKKQALSRTFIAWTPFTKIIENLQQRWTSSHDCLFSKKLPGKLYFSNQLIHFSDTSFHLHEANELYNCDMCKLGAAQNIVLPPYQQVLSGVCTNAETGLTTGTAEAKPTEHIYMINVGATPENFTVLALN